MFRGVGSRKDGLGYPVRRCCVTTASLSSSSAAAGHPGVRLLVGAPSDIHRQRWKGQSTSVFVLCVHHRMTVFLLRVTQRHFLCSDWLSAQRSQSLLVFLLSLILWFPNLSLNSEDIFSLIKNCFFRLSHRVHHNKRVTAVFLCLMSHRACLCMWSVCFRRVGTATWGRFRLLCRWLLYDLWPSHGIFRTFWTFVVMATPAESQKDLPFAPTPHPPPPLTELWAR